MESRIKAVMAAVLGVSQDAISDASSMGNTNGWDSLKNIKLVIALEEEFGVELDENDIVSMTDYQQIIHILKQKI